MKKKICIISLTIGFIIFFPWVVIFMLCGPSVFNRNVYKDTSNIYTFNVVLEEYNYFDTDIVIYLDFKHENEYFYNSFRLDGDAFKIAKQNGFIESLEIGKEYTITAHPAYLGDGWIYPIFEIYDETKTYLAFQEGYKIALKQSEESYKAAIVPITIVSLIEIISVATFAITGLMLAIPALGTKE